MSLTISQDYRYHFEVGFGCPLLAQPMAVVAATNRSRLGTPNTAQHDSGIATGSSDVESMWCMGVHVASGYMCTCCRLYYLTHGVYECELQAVVHCHVPITISRRAVRWICCHRAVPVSHTDTHRMSCILDRAAVHNRCSHRRTNRRWRRPSSPTMAHMRDTGARVHMLHSVTQV